MSCVLSSSVGPRIYRNLIIVFDLFLRGSRLEPSTELNFHCYMLCLNNMSSRRPLLLLPGLLCTERVFKHQIKSLRERYPLQIPSVSTHLSIKDLAQSILAVAPPTFAVAGLSFGGYVALEMIRQAPERVDRLALISSQARPDSMPTTQRRRTMMHLALTEGNVDSVLARQLPLLLHPSRVPPLIASQESGDTTLPSSLAFDAVQYPEASAVLEMGRATSVPEFILQQEAIMSRGDTREALKQYAKRHKVLILGGSDDALIPRRVAEEMFEVASSSTRHDNPEGHNPSRANVTMVIVPRTGHLVTLEEPQVATEELAKWMDGI